MESTMNINKKLSEFRNYLISLLATKFHYFLLFAIICGIAGTFLIGRPDFAIRGIIYFVPGILIAILLVKLYHKGEKYPDTLFLIQGNKKIFQIVFVALFVLSILALYFSSYRPWYYFLIITTIFCVIFLQIFHNKFKPSIILFEISCVMANIIFGLQLKYPLYFGFTDIIPHLNLSKITLLSGHIVPEDLSYGYAWFPLYHIFIATGTNLLGIDIRYAFIVLTTLAFIVIIWVIYLLFNQIIKNDQTSLLICLFFSTTPIVITYSTYVVTRVMAFFGFVFFLFLAHKQIQTAKWRSFSLLTMLFSLYLILVHQVSILQILTILFLFLLLEVLINDYFAIKTRIIAFIIITFSTYWIFTSFFFTNVIIQTADSTTIPGLSRLSNSIQFGNEYSFLIENISTAIIIFFVILGVGYICWAYKSKYPAVIGLFALIMCPLYFPSPLTASAFALITLRIDRYLLLISPFFAFALGIGFLLLLNILYENKYTRKMAIIFGLLLFSYLCFSALTDVNAKDSKDLPSDQNRVHFTEMEMDAINFIPQYVAYNASISSDQYTSRMFEQPFFSKTKTLNIPSYYGYGSLYSNDPYSFRDGYFILRNQELKEKGLRFESMSIDYGETFEPTQETLLKFSNLTFASQKIYDNQMVSILSNLR
jgi:hypothetical protein